MQARLRRWTGPMLETNPNPAAEVHTMLSPALILIAFEVLCHALLALLHLLDPLGLPPLPHRERETLAGLLYAAMAGALLVWALFCAH
jgi:hypothetical protein